MGALPASSGSAPESRAMSSPKPIADVSSRAQAIIVAVDDSVSDAQRAYGRYLHVVSRPEKESTRSLAAGSYRAVCAEARRLNLEAMNELVRVLGEEGLLADLALDPSDLLRALPPTWWPACFRARSWAADELAALVESQASGSPGRDVAARELFDRADRASDTVALAWLTVETDEPIRSAAFASQLRAWSLLVQSLADQQLPDSPPSPRAEEDWLARARVALTTVDLLVSKEADYAVSPGQVERLRADHRRLLERRREVEGRWVLMELATMFAQRPRDLALWQLRADHLMRRARAWLQEVGEATGLGEQLRAEMERADAHGRSWAQQYMTFPSSVRMQEGVGYAFADAPGLGEVLPAPPGTCRYCASPDRGETFCRNCGVRMR